MHRTPASLVVGLTVVIAAFVLIVPVAFAQIPAARPVTSSTDIRPILERSGWMRGVPLGDAEIADVRA